MCGAAVAWLLAAFGCLVFGGLGFAPVDRRGRGGDVASWTRSPRDDPPWERLTSMQMDIFRLLRLPFAIAGICFTIIGIAVASTC